MKKRILALVLIMVIAFSGLAGAATKVRYLVGGDGNNAPKQIGSPRQPLQGGFITEIVEEIFVDSKYELKPIVGSWPRLIKGIKNNKYDNWILYGSPSGAFKQADVTSELLYTDNHVLVTRGETDFKFSSVEDLFEKQLVLVHGYNYGELDQYLKEGKVKAYRPKQTSQALKMLKRGRGFAHVGSEVQVKYNMQQLGFDLNNYQFHNFNSVFSAVKMGLQYDKDMPQELKDFIDQRLREMKETGKIDQIMNKYTGNN